MSQRIKRTTLVFATLALSAITATAGFWGYEGKREGYLKTVWAYDLPSFEEAAYVQAVEAVFSAFEENVGEKIQPGEKGRAGINVDTNSGLGMSTPPALTRAVIEALVKRGFKRKDLLIVDASTSRLRGTGYLPALSERRKSSEFAGVPVQPLDTGALWDETWFYDNPLPVQFSSELGRQLLHSGNPESAEEARKSYLPKALLTDVDFWINLPIVTDHPALGIDGALSAATLWSASNRDRFFLSPSNAPVAVAEIGAIPEWVSGWLLNIVTLENYQFIGGPQFNSLYSVSEPRLLASVNPVVLDAIVLKRVNAAREEHGFQPLEDILPLFEYTQNIGLGRFSPEAAEMRELNAKPEK